MNDDLDRKLQVTVNLDALIYFAESRLQETLQFASFGLAAADAQQERLRWG